MRSYSDEDIARLANTSTPMSVLGGDRIEQNWIVRSIGELPRSPVDLVSVLELQGKDFVDGNYGIYEQPTVLAAAYPKVELVPISERHMVVRVMVRSTSFVSSGAGMAVNQEILRRLHVILGLDELQGFPIKFWPLIFGSGS